MASEVMNPIGRRRASWLAWVERCCFIAGRLQGVVRLGLAATAFARCYTLGVDEFDLARTGSSHGPREQYVS